MLRAADLVANVATVALRCPPAAAVGASAEASLAAVTVGTKEVRPGAAVGAGSAQGRAGKDRSPVLPGGGLATKKIESPKSAGLVKQELPASRGKEVRGTSIVCVLTVLISGLRAWLPGFCFLPSRGSESALGSA